MRRIVVRLINSADAEVQPSYRRNFGPGYSFRGFEVPFRESFYPHVMHDLDDDLIIEWCVDYSAGTWRGSQTLRPGSEYMVCPLVNGDFVPISLREVMGSQGCLIEIFCWKRGFPVRAQQLEEKFSNGRLCGPRYLVNHVTLQLNPLEDNAT